MLGGVSAPKKQVQTNYKSSSQTVYHCSLSGLVQFPRVLQQKGHPEERPFKVKRDMYKQAPVFLNDVDLASWGLPPL